MSTKLTIGAVLSSRDETARAAFAEVCELLAEELEQPVELLMPPSPAELARAVGQGDAQLGWVSPTLLLMAPRLASAVPLLSAVRSGRAYFHSVLFTLRDTVSSVDEMAAMRAAWVAPTSAAGYLLPCLSLTRMGIELSHAIAEERFFGTHTEVARAVADGYADVGATYANYQDGDANGPLKDSGFADILAPDEVAVLAVTGPIPADMIVAHPSLPAERRSAIADALVRLSKRPDAAAALQRAIHTEGFQLVSPQALEELGELVTASLELRLTTSAEISRML